MPITIVIERKVIRINIIATLLPAKFTMDPLRCDTAVPDLVDFVVKLELFRYFVGFLSRVQFP